MQTYSIRSITLTQLITTARNGRSITLSYYSPKEETDTTIDTPHLPTMMVGFVSLSLSGNIT